MERRVFFLTVAPRFSKSSVITHILEWNKLFHNCLYF